MPGRVEIPMGNGEVMVVQGVSYSESYSDNVFVVVGLAVTSPWIATPTEVVSPEGWCYPLERFEPSDAAGMIFLPDQAERARCLTFIKGHTPSASPIWKKRTAHRDVDLGTLPLSLDSLPGAIREAILLSHINTGDVLTYLEHHRVVQSAGRVVLPGWMEQPTSVAREKPTVASIRLCVRTPERLDGSSSRFGLAPSPVRPSVACLVARGMDGDPTGSIAQLARMTDSVPRIHFSNPATTENITIAISCTPEASGNLTVTAWSAGKSRYNYLSEQWAIEYGAELT